MVPITVPIPGTIVPAAPPRSAPEIVRFLSAQALVCSHRSAGLVSASLVLAGLVLAGLVLAGLVLAGLVLSFMLLPYFFWKSAWMLAHPPHRRDVAVRPHRRQSDALQPPAQMRRARRAVPAARHQRARSGVRARG